MRQANSHERLMCSNCAIISSIHSAEHAYTVQSMHTQCRVCIHSAEHACWDSTSMCSIHEVPYNTHNKKSHLQAAATIRERLTCRPPVAKSVASIRERLTCRPAVAKVRLLF